VQFPNVRLDGGAFSRITSGIFGFLQLDIHNLRLGRRHLVNAYEVKAGIGVIAGNIV